MKSPKKQEWIHFIGICGVAMSALAIMAKKQGHKITGSDVGFYPPISTHLLKNKIKFYPGWHPENIGEVDQSQAPRNDNAKPDLVVVGNVAGSTNPEFLFVQKNNIPYVSYPEFIAKYLIKKNSIVCAGTYGKTSTSALLSFILQKTNYKPAYMFGGLTDSLKLSADDGGGNWSVVEGDEYKTSRWENTAKFFHYSPTHLLLTAVKWDHADVYTKEQLYFEAFEKLINIMPNDGLMVVNENVKNEILKQPACRTGRVQDDKKDITSPSPSLKRGGCEIASCLAMTNNGWDDKSGQDNKNKNDKKIIIYGKLDNCDYQYLDVKSTKKGLDFKIKHQSTIYHLQSDLLGNFQVENICGAFAMAHEIGINPKKIIKAVKKFKGIKRRLEIRGKTKNGAIVIDDIAHSPDKVKSVLETLSNIYKYNLKKTSDDCLDPSVPQDDSKVIVILSEAKNLDSSIPAYPVGKPQDDKCEILKQVQDDKLKQNDEVKDCFVPRNDSMCEDPSIPQDDKIKITCIFEPNTGNRNMESIPAYDYAFSKADEVIIPKLTKIKISADDPTPPFEGEKLTGIISKTQPHTKYIDDDEKLIDYLIKNNNKNDVIVFCGSHGFRGMIEKLVK